MAGTLLLAMVCQPPCEILISLIRFYILVLGTFARCLMVDILNENAATFIEKCVGKLKDSYVVL